MAGFFKRVKKILKNENIEFENEVVAHLIKKYFPDFRRTLNELQRYGSSGKISSDVLGEVFDSNITDLVIHLKDKNFTEMRKWVSMNTDQDINSLFRRLYDSAYEFVKPEFIPRLVLILADYQYKSAFVVDQEINLVAAMTEMMVDLEYE